MNIVSFVIHYMLIRLHWGVVDPYLLDYITIMLTPCTLTGRLSVILNTLYIMISQWERSRTHP